MKLYICINKTSLPGYTHIDPIPKDNIPAFQGSIQDLNQIAGKGECEEILAPELLDYLSPGQLDQSLSELASLLHHEGKLIIGGTEFYELCRGVFIGQVTSDQVNNLLFNSQIRKNGIYSVEEIKEKLVNLELKIQSIKINNGTFIIEAFRE